GPGTATTAPGWRRRRSAPHPLRGGGTGGSARAQHGATRGRVHASGPGDLPEEVAEVPAHLLVLDEEAVVPVRGADVPDRSCTGLCVRDSLRLVRGEGAVGVYGDDLLLCRDPRERRRVPATVPADVVGEHRAGERDVAVGVEAQRELGAVVVEVGLDGEPPAE